MRTIILIPAQKSKQTKSKVKLGSLIAKNNFYIRDKVFKNEASNVF